MLINIVDSLFSSLCCGNDARSFAVEGQVLPFCQRCTGVYLGLAVTFVYLLGTRAYRRRACGESHPCGYRGVRGGDGCLRLSLG